MTREELDFNLLEVEKGNKRYGVFIKNYIHTLEEENKQLREIIKKAKKYSKDLQEKYFKMSVLDSNSDFIELLVILDGED